MPQEGTDTYPINYRYRPRARYYRITVQKDGSVNVIIPLSGNKEDARKFVEQQRNWIQRTRVRQQSHPQGLTEWTLGCNILWRGQWCVLEKTFPEIEGKVRLGNEVFSVSPATVNFRRALEAAFLRLAKIELPARAWALAANIGAPLKSISVRNQRTRWGSCSSNGRISLNWRLLQMPEFVGDYIICHELAHLKHMNHSAHFWQEVSRIFPRWQEAEHWIKKHNSFLIF